jgi:hypothetical protein
MFDGDPVRWSDVDATVLRACLDALTGQGHAVLLGRTSTGDGLTGCFFVGSAKAKKFWNTSAACETFMRGYTEWLLANMG